MWNRIDNVEQIEHWQQVAAYWSIKAGLRSMAHNLIILGLMFSALFPLLTGADSFLTISVPLLIGIPLLVTGVLIVLAPSLSASINYAILVLGLIANVIIITWAMVFAEPDQGLIPLPLVIVQVVGYVWISFQLWSASKSLPQGISAEDVASIDDLATELRRVDTQSNPEYIKFSDSLKLYRETIKCKLSTNTVLFLFQRKKALVLTRKEETHIVTAQNVPLHKELQVQFQVANTRMTVFILPESLERFRHWKEAG